MQVQLNAYLSFRDNARQAMEFYKDVFGGTLNLSTFKDYHASQDPSEDNLVMHSELKGENSIVFMASDTPSRMEHRTGTNFSMSLSGDDEKQLRRYWDKLSRGASIRQALTKAAWGDTFGMLTDKFGIVWLVNIAAPKA